MKNHRINLFITKDQTEFLTDLAYRYSKETGRRVSVSVAIRASIQHLKGLSEPYQSLILREQTELEGHSV